MTTERIIKLFLLVAFMMSSSTINAGKANGVIKILVDNDKEYYEDDNVKVKFSMISENLYMNVYNKLDERIFIEWENARTNNNKVIFGTDNRLSVRNKKEDEAISSKSLSLSRCFYCENPMSALGGVWAMPVYTHGILNLEEEEFCSVTFILPIRMPDGKTKDYKIYVKVMYVNLADASQITIGMKPKEVKKIIGDPNSIKKFGVSKMENWLYTNNVRVMFENNKVVNIVNLKTQ